MKTKIKVILITLLTLLLLALGLFFAITQKKQSTKYFIDSGYIVGNVYESDSKVQVVHFDENASYKNHSNNELKFTDSDGNKTIISKENFVHYSNNSIMALKDGVAIDLETIDSKLIKYYNIFSGSVLQKSNEGYEIKNLDEIIEFKKIMFKISDNKYLIAANNIIVSFSENQTINFKDYIEIEYVNENVIRVYNNEENYQTISSNLYILIDNIKIDLGYKTIEKNSVQYLTMANLVINSNDNIEVLPEKEKVEIEEETESNAQSGNGQNSGSNTGNGVQNDINTEILEGLTPIAPDETVKEESVIQPKFTVESFETTMLGFDNLIITAVDESGIIYGDSTVQIIENSTGKIVGDLLNWENGNTTYTVNSYTNLKPDTEYTLVVSGKYEIDSTIYDRVYVSKIFRTLDIGLEIIGDCATSDSLSFAIYKMDYTNIESITFDLLDSNNKSVLEQPKKLNYIEDYVLAAVDGLVSNSEYTLVIKNIQYGDDIMSTENASNLQMSYKMKTLKQRPDLNVKLSADVNPLKNQLLLKLDGIQDVNKGLKNYVYKIYLTEQDMFSDKKPIYVVTKTDSSEVTIDIAENLIQGESYYFNVELEFDDNEKTIIYSTEYSNPVSTSEIVYPTVVNYVSAEEVICEELVGFLNIDDSDAFIKYNNITEYQVVLREKGNALSVTADEATISLDGGVVGDYITLPVSFKDLKPNTEYVMYTYLKNGNQTIYIGYVNAKTTETDSIYLDMENDETNKDSNLFKFKIKLDSEYFNETNIQMSGVYNYIKDNLNYIKLSLYGCNNNYCIPLERLPLEPFEKTITEANASGELLSLIEGNELLLTSSDFGFYAENYNANYDSYRVKLIAESKANFEIPLFINEEKTNFFEVTILDNIPTVEVKYTEITNADSAKKDELLDETTTVGYRFNLTETYSTKGIGIRNFNYYIYEGKCSEKGVLITSNTTVLSNTISRDHVVDIYFEDYGMTRGNHYCFEFDTDYYNSELNASYNSNSGSIDLVSQRQTSKIKGALVKYEENAITFKLKLDDFDGEIKRLYIKNELVEYESQKLECQGDYCYYKFDISKLTETTKFALLVDLEKIYGETIETQPVYEFTLKEIKPLLGDIGLDVENINGKLYFTLDDLGVDVFGLKVINTITNEHKYLQFTNQENKYVATINNSNLSDYGIKKDGFDIKFSDVKFEVIYNDGSIDVTSDFVGIRQSNYNINTALYYYNSYTNVNIFDNKILLNSIYLKDGLKNIETSLTIELKDLTYVSSDENTQIGQSVASNLIHLYKIFFKELVLTKNSVVVDTVLLTSNETKYTSDGAYLNFTVVDEDIFAKLEKVKFEMTCGNETNSIEWSWNDSNKNWTYSNDNAFVETIKNNDNSIISLRVKNISEYDSCQYQLLYKKTDETGYLTSINSENNKENKNSITSLKELVIDNKNFSYESNYWHLNEDGTDVIFEKKLNYAFEMLKNYVLENNETLYYNIIIKDENNTEIVVESDLKIDDLVLKVSNVKEIYDKIASGEIPSQTYMLMIQPYIKNTERNKTYYLSMFGYENTFTIEKSQPSFTAHAYQDLIYLNVRDNDGIFKQWDSLEISQGINLNESTDNVIDTIYDKKLYHFEILNESNAIIAYKPMSFVTQTQTISLKELFENKKIQNGTYNARICYYAITSSEKICTGNNPVKILSSNVLNASIMQISKSYLLDLDNPNEEVKDTISKIKYTAVYNDGTTATWDVSKIEFITRINSDGTKSYFLELPIGVLTSNVKQFEVKILDINSSEITTVLYK